MSKIYDLVPFHDTQVLTIRDGDLICVPVRPLVEGIGLDWSAQRQRLLRHTVLSKGVVMITTPSQGGEQEMLCLDLKLIPGFLATIETRRISDLEVRARVELFQSEAFEALYVYFFGPMRIAQTKPATITDFLRVGNSLKTERNSALRDQLWRALDKITDSLGLPRTGRAIGYADPDYTDLLREFWSAVRSLEECGITINHSRKNDLIAINMPALRAHFAETGTEILIDTTLMKALQRSTDPRYIDQKPVNCRDGKTRACWVFSVVPA